MTQHPRATGTKADRPSGVYEALVQTVRARDDGLNRTSPPELDSESVADYLHLPLELWARGAKPSRTVPALVAYDRSLDQNRDGTLERILVGLDVLVTMLDEFVDSDPHRIDDRYRLRLAVNTAFASLLSFGSVPATAKGRVLSELLHYLIETARIPSVERTVQGVLDTRSTPGELLDILEFAYAYRARDISAFGKLPPILHDIDDGTAERVQRDLMTYRAHYLVFDDLRDVSQDRADGIENPVMWLLRACDRPEEVVDQLAAVYAAFEYSDNTYCSTLRELEQRPTDLRQAVASAMEELDVASSKVASK